MAEISKPVVKVDHGVKARGEALYVADCPGEGVLCGKLLRSDRARAKLLSVRLPDLPEGYTVADWRDVPGENAVHIVMDDTPVFARDTVEFIGDPIAMVAGPDEAIVDRILREIHVEYEDLPPVLDIREADTVFFDYGHTKGDVDGAFAAADKIYDEEFETGYQEQAYLEPQGMVAVPGDGKVTVHGSIQCPYYVHTALAKALGLGPDGVRVVQDTTGGGFGGKEDYPSILACQVAVAALKAGRPVRTVFSRGEDMAYTSKRHPSLSRYRVAVQDGRVTAMDIDIRFNSGAYTTLSAVVLQRGVICANGVYAVPNLRVRGRGMKTNTVPTGAFRGFGAPQTFFAVERIMDHIAMDLGQEPLSFKLTHLVHQGDPTSTGGRYHFPVPLPDMVEKIDRAADYRKKRAAYAGQTGRYRRGVGLSLNFHGAGFTGSGERDMIKAVAALEKDPEGRVEILVANADIGQGVKTTFSKIVAHELGLPLDRVTIANPDTDRVPDSGPTVASRSLMIVGELLRRAAAKLRSQWRDGERQRVEERFREPDFMIPFSLDDFQGDAYPTYAWAVTCIELEVDTLTGEHTVLGAWGCYDVGTPVDENVVMGQMEGGLLQGIGYAHMEHMACDSRGRIRGAGFADYTIPTSADVPELNAMLHVEEYPDGPYGAKGAGELPLVGVSGAYMAALEQALGTGIRHTPFTQEDTLNAIEEVGRT